MTNKAEFAYLNELLKKILEMMNKDDWEYLNELPKESKFLNYDPKRNIEVGTTSQINRANDIAQNR